MSASASPGIVTPGGNAIGFLRVVLATLVIYTHTHFLGGFQPEFASVWTGGRLSLGTLAVECFFIISGWLLAQSWQRRPLLWAYLRNRALRLLPAWWVCLAVTALVFAPLVFFSTASPTHFWRQEPGPVSYLWKNLFLPRSQIAIGQTLSTNPWGSDWNGSLWTLFYEGAAYLLLAAAGMTGLLRRNASWGIGAILALLILNALWQWTGQPVVIKRLFDTPGKGLCLHFAAGAAIALAPSAWRRRLTGKMAGLICAGLLVLAWKFDGGAALSPLFLPIAVLYLALSLPFYRWESLVGGDYSYGLYLYAYPVGQLLTFFGLQRWGYAPYFSFNMIGAALCAVASWHWVECPALSFAQSSRNLPLPRSSPQS